MEWTESTFVRERFDREEDVAWESFVDRFRQPVVRFARNFGLTVEEAEDVAQETLLGFLSAYRAGRYDRMRGQLGSWLFGFAHRNALKARGRRVRDQQRLASGQRTSCRDTDENDASVRPTWGRPRELALVEQCLQQVRREVKPRTIRAFEAVAFRHRCPSEVAQELGMSRNAVYLAKHRVLKRLRELRKQIDRID